MSLGYAEKLSYREDLGGQLGAAELSDTLEQVEARARQLAELVRSARRIIVFTGAGISTACGIPDFRGPQGIWTLQRAGKPLPRPKVSFTHAKPSLTHQVLVALMQSGKLDYLVSQNVDGLHLRSGIPRARLAELHGNCFAERCYSCGTEYVRDFEVETVGFKRTGRKCSQPGCTAALRDNILDWEDALPEDELQLSEEHAKQADLAICLGTSLQITPACNLPLKATRTYKGGLKEEPGRLVIINLQRTQHDNKAVKSGGFVCHARCDDVMRLTARHLQLTVPPYIRRDAVIVGLQQHSCQSSAGVAAARQKAGPQNQRPAAPPAAQGGCGSDDTADGPGSGTSDTSQLVPFTIFVRSTHGPKCPLPMIQAVELRFEDPSLPPAFLDAPPFRVQQAARRYGPVHARITLNLHEAADADKRTVNLSYTATLQAGATAANHEQRFEFITQVVTYDDSTDHDSTARSTGCGHLAAVTRDDQQLREGVADAAAADAEKILKRQRLT